MGGRKWEDKFTVKTGVITYNVSVSSIVTERSEDSPLIRASVEQNKFLFSGHSKICSQ